MRVFVTGASGWIGSAVVPELLAAGHDVIGLARSDVSAEALLALGAEAQRGDLDDLDVLRKAAAESDGVVHLAFKHDVAFVHGDFAAAADADRRAVETIGEALSGSGRPLVVASGVIGLAPGRLATERDAPDIAALGSRAPGMATRAATAELTIALSSGEVRSSVLRLPPTCHGAGDNGFMAFLVATARAKGISGYPGDGSSRWPATHRLDVASCFRLALEKAPAGSTLQAVAEEGVPMRSIAEAIGRRLDVPVAAIPAEEVGAHFGFLAGFIGIDSPASSALTRQLLGWQPTRPGLVEDIAAGRYTASD